jgi:ApaG protein
MMENLTHYRIQISVRVKYLSEQSDEAENRFVFAYTINVANEGDQSVKLIARHWVITDANQHVQAVNGKGVVGEQPVINPGQSFEYTSGTVLATQVGTMSGSYQMSLNDGTEFTVPIQQFVLSVPRVLH